MAMDVGRIAAAAMGFAVLSACAPVGGSRASTYYECSRGTVLKVDYLRSGALVGVDGAPAVSLRRTPAASGAAYESKSGLRLHTKGREALWNTAARTAPETCRQTGGPR